MELKKNTEKTCDIGLIAANVLAEAFGTICSGIIPTEDVVTGICDTCGDIIVGYIDERRLTIERAVEVAAYLAEYINNHSRVDYDDQNDPHDPPKSDNKDNDNDDVFMY